MPTVAIAHSASKHRSINGVGRLVREALQQIGGLEAFVKPGQRLLLMPDQNCARLAEEGSTTDPLLVGALTRLAWEAGVASVQVAASSGGGLSAGDCMRFTGVAEVARQEGAELVDLVSAEVEDREVYLPEGLFINTVRLPAPLLDNDVIIAIPKARTDSRDVVAASLQFCLASLNRRWQARQADQEGLIERLADVMTALRADLWITDALICGEGDGPHANVPHWCGCILASSDPVATDHTIARLLGRDPLHLRFAHALEVRGVGYGAPIVYLGAALERHVFKAWPSHHGFERFPVNVLLGDGVTENGSIGRIKEALETLTNEGLLAAVLHGAGTPTFLIGDAEDDRFEEHVQQGPYIVCDDAAPAKYRQHASVSFVSGHPVTVSATDEIRQLLRRHLMKRDSIIPHPTGNNNRVLAAALACAGIGLMLCLESAGGRR